MLRGELKDLRKVDIVKYRTEISKLTRRRTSLHKRNTILSSPKGLFFAKRAIQSLKHIIYRYIEDHGEKFIIKLTQFVSTMYCSINRSIGKSPRDVKKTYFLSVVYNKPLTRYRKLKFKVGDRVRISKNDTPFQKGYKPQFTDEIFEISAISTNKPPTYIIKHLVKEEILGNFYKKQLKNVQIRVKSFFKLNFYQSVVMDSFIELVSNASFFVIQITASVLLQTFFPNKYI